jgi:DNA repair photolyase
VRWDNLQIDAEDQATLPGYREPAVVRHFDAPEALDTRFYEVRAKSALNRVPDRSRMPFRWTINPYRGCSHACHYCLWPDTPVLLADGRTKPIERLRVGERIVGTALDGRYRRYVETEVLDHWSVIKPVYAVHLEDGTRILTSGDHRFLTNRGWKHVVAAGPGEPQRPYLTTNNELLGTGGFETAPKACEEYRRGYLCGMIRGDGHLSSREYTPSGRRATTIHRFRLALVDDEALTRAADYLALAGVSTSRYRFAAAGERNKEAWAIASGAREAVQRIREVVAWPRQPTVQWRKGFLAGIFDAEGSCRPAEAVRIANTDGTIVHWVRDALERLGFDSATDCPPRDDGYCSVRFRGGLKERLRFFHLTDPAITRKRTIMGVALKSDACTRVVAVEPLGMSLPLYDITTGTGDFIANGVVSHNCFARPTHVYLGMNAGRDFEKEIVVKINVPEVLRAELARPSWKGEHVAMGTNTDPYQWVEGRYRLMRGIWQALRHARNPCSVLTKSPLLLRDLDLLREIAQVTSISANLSIPTMEEKAWRASEPHTPHPRARMEAVAELNRSGIPAGILIAPLMPGINDDPAQVERILQAAADAGATGVSGVALHLRGEVRGVFMEWLRSYRPDLVDRYEELYRRGAYAPEAERARLAALVTMPGGPPLARFSRQMGSAPPADRKRTWGEPAGEPAAAPRPSRPSAVQEALF